MLLTKKRWICFWTLAFFIDDSTFIEGIKRLYPGNYLVIENGDCIIKEYYLADYDKEYIEPSIAIEKLDTAFNNAMLRIANKNKEYGYKNVLDISGGLDSRIICYAAKRLEIDNSILITYSQSDSHEDKITKRIANDLGFDLYYKTLDNGKCLKEIDKLVFMNNGTAYYHGITGGGDFLEVLSNQSLGMEYTGLLGNMYDNSMITEYGDKEPIVNYPKFIGSKINKINDKYNNNKILKKFSNNDLFWLYTRGMLAGMSTFLTRQNFLEPVAPFGDIEFLEVFLKIPWEERMEENILRRWFIEKYPNAAQIPYATTGYSILKENNKFHKYRVLLKLYMSKALTMIQRKPLPHNMNPINYWLMKDPSINEYIKKYYELEIDNINVDDHLINKMKKMYNESEDYIDKSIVLTVLSFSKQFVK